MLGGAQGGLVRGRGRSQQAGAVQQRQRRSCVQRRAWAGSTLNTFSGYLAASTLHTTSWSPPRRIATTVSCGHCTGRWAVRPAHPCRSHLAPARTAHSAGAAAAHHRQRHGQHAIALVVDVLANQVDAACRRRQQRAAAGRGGEAVVS